MKRLLLLLGAAALLVAGPAAAQYIFLDTNSPGHPADGICDAGDVLSSSTTNIDIYFDPTHNRNGTPVTCQDGTHVLDMFSYGFVLRASGAGSVTYGTYTDQVGFGDIILAAGGAGSDFWVGRGGGTPLAPQATPFKVGSLAVTVTGNPVVDFITASPAELNSFTIFGSDCLSPINGPTWVWDPLGNGDWTDACGTTPLTPTLPTTWGAIKKLYR